MENKSKELEIAIEAALEAGKMLKKHFETDILKEFKEDKSIVTVADRESETIIKNKILGSFPNHSIFGEETGHTENGNEYTWHIDPVDGTRNFSNGLPLFSVSIALEYMGELLVGVIYNPATDSLFYGEKGKGAFFGDKQIFVSKDDASHGIISAGKSRKDSDRKLCRKLLHDLPAIMPGLTVRDLGASALDFAYIARGGIEATIQLGLSSYDFAAGIILVSEAGGKITKLDGSEWKFPENNFVVSNGVFHDSLVKEIKKIKETLEV